MCGISSGNGTSMCRSGRTTRFSKRATYESITHGPTQRASYAAHASCCASLSCGPQATEPRTLETDIPIFVPRSKRISCSRNPISQTCAARKKSISSHSSVSLTFREDWVPGHEEFSRRFRARRDGLHRVPPPPADAKHLNRDPRPGALLRRDRRKPREGGRASGREGLAGVVRRSRLPCGLSRRVEEGWRRYDRPPYGSQREHAHGLGVLGPEGESDGDRRSGADERCRPPASPAAQRARRRPRSHRNGTTGILPERRATRVLSRKDDRIRSVARNPLRIHPSVLPRGSNSDPKGSSPQSRRRDWCGRRVSRWLLRRPGSRARPASMRDSRVRGCKLRRRKERDAVQPPDMVTSSLPSTATHNVLTTRGLHPNASQPRRQWGSDHDRPGGTST